MKHCCINQHRWRIVNTPHPRKNWLYSAVIFWYYYCSYWLACNSSKTNFEIWIYKSTSVLTQPSLLDSRANFSNWAKCFDLKSHYHQAPKRHCVFKRLLRAWRWPNFGGLILVRTCCSIGQINVMRLMLTGLFI